VQDCSIGWLQGLVCSEIEYRDGGNGVVLNIKQLSCDRGFLALIAAPKNLGAIYLHQPVFELTGQPYGSRLLTEQVKWNSGEIEET
jgi:hypothetical protein